LDDDAHRRTDAEQQEQPMVVLDRGKAVSMGGGGEGHEDADGDDVVEDRG
jgi:hypothetical protein